LSAARKVMVRWLPKLQDPDPQVRRDAAAALGALGPVAKPAVHSLLGIANDPNTIVRDRVVRALARSRCLPNWSHEDSPRRCRIRNGPYAMRPLAPFRLAEC
jgi:HEAT repeat protein